MDYLAVGCTGAYEPSHENNVMILDLAFLVPIFSFFPFLFSPSLFVFLFTHLRAPHTRYASSSLPDWSPSSFPVRPVASSLCQLGALSYFYTTLPSTPGSCTKSQVYLHTQVLN